MKPELLSNLIFCYTVNYLTRKINLTRFFLGGGGGGDETGENKKKENVKENGKGKGKKQRLNICQREEKQKKRSTVSAENNIYGRGTCNMVSR
jgi:hypothetical protein